ncbi:hypothetical protein GDO81_017577 [Engystomops pustulosus]|uniref:Cyanocobalamin reductase / alkylcobalamin dealkylase n=1 Tax=Engystomops pustulosus TaxID=76066 RepID=A0AAV7A2X3_ENGPU|nr:hypothetical protein GDO81_017577 [Engystomops pustulosus]
MGSHVQILEGLQGALQPQGFEVYLFQVGWYNDILEPSFHLSYPPDTLAFVVLSAPSMFEKSFKPFLAQHKLHNLRDPIDQCVAHHMGLVKEKMFGVCVHPKYGGWFAIRAVLVFSEVQIPRLEQTPPIDCVPAQEDRIRLLENFNFNWRDGKYREVVAVEERYSVEQTLYFSTPPAERRKLLDLWGQVHPSPPC